MNPTILMSPQRAGLRPGEVMLTFDDGPNPHGDTTDRLLDALAARGVRAAFCLIGRHAAAHPRLTRRIADGGHLLVNHFTHHCVPFSTAAAGREIDGWERLVGEVLGCGRYESAFVRPACGLMTRGVREALAARGKRIVPVTFFAWDMLVGPWGKGIVRRATCRNARRRGGGMYVLHDGLDRVWPPMDALARGLHLGRDRAWVPETAAAIIDRLREEGMTIVEPGVWMRR